MAFINKLKIVGYTDSRGKDVSIATSAINLKECVIKFQYERTIFSIYFNTQFIYSLENEINGINSGDC